MRTRAWRGWARFALALVLALGLAVMSGAAQLVVTFDDTITAIFTAGREGLQLIARTVGAQDFFEGCQRAGLAVGVVNSPEEAFENHHFKARGMQVPVLHEDIGRTVIYPGAPFSLPKAPWQLSRRAPRLGEHNLEILGRD